MVSSLSLSPSPANLSMPVPPMPHRPHLRPRFPPLGYCRYPRFHFSPNLALPPSPGWSLALIKSKMSYRDSPCFSPDESSSLCDPMTETRRKGSRLPLRPRPPASWDSTRCHPCMPWTPLSLLLSPSLPSRMRPRRPAASALPQSARHRPEAGITDLTLNALTLFCLQVQRFDLRFE